jgi:hypothetical protein
MCWNEGASGVGYWRGEILHSQSVWARGIVHSRPAPSYVSQIAPARGQILLPCSRGRRYSVGEQPSDANSSGATDTADIAFVVSNLGCNN